MKPNTNARKRRGSVLYLALLFIAVINLLALAYVKAIPLESNSFLRSQRALKAHYACEAGVFDSMAWIAFELANGREPTASGVVTRTGTHDSWTWRATIEADSESPPGGKSSLRFYEVQCEAFASGSLTPSRRIRATMGEETFARLTNFVDVFPTWVYTDLISGGAFIEGHSHTNTYYQMLPSDARYASATEPSYNGYVTSAQIAPPPWDYDGVNYMEMSQAPYDGARKPIPPRYERLFKGGRSGLNTGVNRIELPANSTGLEVRAWGEDVPRPSTGGVHMNVDGEIKGGILINGEVQELLLESLGNASQLTITQDLDADGISEKTIIVEAHDGPAILDGKSIGVGQTGVLWPDLSSEVLNGIPNGVVHSTDSILSLRGTNRGERLISADLASNKTITITGDILRADTPQGARPGGSRDVLGIVTYRLIIGKAVPRTSSDPLYLYFSYLCGKEEPNPSGGLEVEDYYDSALGRGSYYLFGSSGAGIRNASGSATSGFGYRQYFDKHLLTHPPPFYPTTGKLPIRSWREEDGNL